jgi:hypothetical protein
VKPIRGGGTAEYHVGPRAGKRRRERHRVHPHSTPRRLNAKDVQPRCGERKRGAVGLARFPVLGGRCRLTSGRSFSAISSSRADLARAPAACAAAERTAGRIDRSPPPASQSGLLAFLCVTRASSRRRYIFLTIFFVRVPSCV